MSCDDDVSRRDFVKLCASAIALAGVGSVFPLPARGIQRDYQRVRLVDADNRPFTAARLKVGETYLFHYPYISTPCFLIDLGRRTQPTALATEDGQRYDWRGGVGPKGSIVAFSAICAHKMSHPAKAVSFINYRHQAVNFVDSDKKTAQRGQVIYCCSERSVYDPAAGARVLGGPAPQPLAAILLNHDAKDGSLYAYGTYGGEMFDKFFQNFGHRIALEMKTTDVRKATTDKATVVRMAEYCQNQILC